MSGVRALPPGGVYPKLSRLMQSERTARDPSIPCTLSMNGGGPQRKMVAEHKSSTWVAIKSQLTRPRGPLPAVYGWDQIKTIPNYERRVYRRVIAVAILT